MNFVEIGEQLQSYPKEQLLAMAQGQLQTEFPQFTILAEIQRRTQMEQAYAAQAARQNDPQQTVYEQSINEFANSGLAQGQSPNGEMMPEEGGSPMQEMAMDQSGEAMPPQGMMSGMPLAEEMPSEGMMQRMPMALGGRVGYQTGGKLEYLKSLGINENDLQAYFERGGMQYRPELVEQLQPSTLRQIQEEVLSGRAEGITEEYYPTAKYGITDVPDTRSYFSPSISGVSSLASALTAATTMEGRDPTIFPTGDETTLEYQTGRQGIRDYFVSAGAPDQATISNFIAYNPDAYSVYSEAGGGLAGMQAVIDANLLGEVDPLTGMLLKPNTKAFKPEPYIKEYSTKTLKDIARDAKEITKEVKEAEAKVVEADTRGLTQVQDIATQITPPVGDIEMPTEWGTQVATDRDDLYKSAMERLGITPVVTEETLAGLRGRIDKLDRPDYEVATARERENELSAMGLATLAKAFGGAKNLGEAAETIGEGIPSLLATKKEQRETANAMMALDRSMDIEEQKLSMEVETFASNAAQMDNQTRLSLETNINQQMALNQDLNQHIDRMKKDWANVDLAHKTLIASNTISGLNAANAIVKLDILKDQAEISKSANLVNVYEGLLEELQEVSEMAIGEDAQERVDLINNRIDRVLGTIFAQQGTGAMTYDEFMSE